MDCRYVDIIILSDARNGQLKALTEQSISTLLDSENPKEIRFNIIVIESNKMVKPYDFKQTDTVYPAEKFGFHKYLNIGIQNTNSPFLCLCNNDLIFHKNWCSEILKAMDLAPEIKSVSPYCPLFHGSRGFQTNTAPIKGYFGLLGGWCIFLKREILAVTGPLDEQLEFWYCDNDYAQTLIKYNINHSLVSTSFVTHLGSESLKLVDQKTYKRLTRLPRLYYQYKWGHKSYLRYKLESLCYHLSTFTGIEFYR